MKKIVFLCGEKNLATCTAWKFVDFIVKFMRRRN